MQVRVRRGFLLLSLSSVLLVLSLSLVWYTHFAKQLLVTQETHANANMTRVLAKLMWSEFSPFIIAGRVDTPERMQRLPEVSALDAVMADFLDGSRILKVKLYNPDGFNLYSTDHVQIGEDKSDNPGVQAALRGETISVLAYRHQFHSFEQTVADRNLLSTYTPMYSPETGDIAGVFELYSDVTDMVQTIDHNRQIMIVMGAVGFGFVFGWMYWLVRRDERIIRAQYDELNDARKLIERLAYQDSLTGLPNRNSFEEAIRQATAPGRREADGFALLYIDLDGFKEVNDRFGHAVGDQLLSETARRLCAALRCTDRVFRVGGDEFTAMLAGVSTEASAARLAEKLVEVVSTPIHRGDQELTVTASVGIGLFPMHGDNADVLVDLSDKAMYQAKQAGSNCYRMAQPKRPQSLQASNG